jgi:hypothetical protein
MGKYVGFKALVASGVPPGAAANIGRKKYGKKNFQEHAAAHEKMSDEVPKKKYRVKPGVKGK